MPKEKEKPLSTYEKTKLLIDEKLSIEEKITNQVKSFLTCKGYTENINYSFIDRDLSSLRLFQPKAFNLEKKVCF